MPPACSCVEFDVPKVELTALRRIAYPPRMNLCGPLEAAMAATDAPEKQGNEFATHEKRPELPAMHTAESTNYTDKPLKHRNLFITHQNYFESPL